MAQDRIRLAFLAYNADDLAACSGDVLMRHGIYAAVNALAAEGYSRRIFCWAFIPERMRGDQTEKP